MDVELTTQINLEGHSGDIPEGTIVRVAISERNLRDLCAQWEQRKHARLARRTDDGFALTIVVEDDDFHYGGREAGPGSGVVDFSTPSDEA